MTDEMVTKWGMQLGIPLVILFLMFIIWDLAKQSKAGRIGTTKMLIYATIHT